MPITLGGIALVLILSCPLLVARNVGYTPFDEELTGRVLDYGGGDGTMRVRLFEADRERGIISVRDDRPWRTFRSGEPVRLLIRSTTNRFGEWQVEYAVDDARALWGALIARAGMALLTGAAAIAVVVFGRRRPSLAAKFPPLIPEHARRAPPPPLRRTVN